MRELDPIDVRPPAAAPSANKGGYTADAAREQEKLKPPVENPDSIKHKWKFRGDGSDNSGPVMHFLKWLGAPYMKFAKSHPKAAVVLPVAGGLGIVAFAILASLAPPTAVIGQSGLGTYLSLFQGNIQQAAANVGKFFEQAKALATQQLGITLRVLGPIAVLAYLTTMGDGDLSEILAMTPVVLLALGLPFAMAKGAKYFTSA